MSEKILSIFIDESGDFGKYEPHSGRYIVGLVFHDQREDISKNISNFETHLKNLGYIHHAVHTGPLIRREQFYANDQVESRKRLFNSLFNCVRKLPVQYACININKKECQNEVELIARISRQLGDIIDNNADFFAGYDLVYIYYDNGQTPLTRIISSVFSSHLQSVEFRKVQPVDYLLFQAADLVCTMELLAEKAENKSFSNSEMEFFDNMRDYKKNYLKWLRKKHI